MGYAQKAGKAFEGELMRYMREKTFDVERLRLTGTEDEGDLLLRSSGERRARFVIEAKRTKSLDLAGWITEAENERNNYCSHRGLWPGASGFVVVHKRRGKDIGGSYVTTTLDEWLEDRGQGQLGLIE